jgi:adenine-specific DNA-methyltransferase
VDEANTRNLYLEGDNLSVLKLLRKAYSGRVKMIYIDPPYNTGNDFVYKDNFAESSEAYLRRSGQTDASGQRLVSNPKAGGRFHSNWLNMIYPRLLLARELLRDDGVIFVSIDDNEVHHLRMVMDEIFGAENFVACIPWKGKGGGADNNYMMRSHEYILLFSNSKDNFQIGEDVKLNESFPRLDPVQNRRYRCQLARKWGANSRREDRPNLYYAVKSSSGDLIYPKLPDGRDGRWRWSQKKMQEEIDIGNVEFNFENNSWVAYERIWEPLDGEVNTKKFSTWFDDIGSTANGTKEIQALFAEKVFDFPKPTSLLNRLIKISNAIDNDIILDFFSGSATTAHAVLAQNQADGGNRRFILVQLPEATDNPPYPTIAEIGKERIRRVITQLRNSATPPVAAATAQTALALTPSESPHLPAAQASDLGFKVFKLAPSVFRDWQDYEGSDPNALRDLFSQAETPLRAGWQAAEVLAEVMLLEGFPLDSLCQQAAAFTHNTVFCVQSEVCQHRLFVCLETQLHPATLQQLAELRRDVFICLDSALSDQAKVRLQDLVTLKVI